MDRKLHNLISFSLFSQWVTDSHVNPPTATEPPPCVTASIPYNVYKLSNKFNTRAFWRRNRRI